MTSETFPCPICKEKKPHTHFACASGAKGGSTKGASKLRDVDYSAIGKKGVIARRKKKMLKKRK